LYVTKYHDDRFAIRLLCATFDLYYDDNIVTDVLTYTPTRRVGEYVKKVEAANGDIRRTYADTLIREGANGSVVTSDDDLLEGHVGVKKKTVRMFGFGYTDEEYAYLQSEYDDWTHRYECNDKSLEESIKNICITQLNIRKAQQGGIDTTRLIKSMNDCISMANLKPVSVTEEKQAYSYGELIGMHEKNAPIKPDPAFEDVDGIMKYIGTFFFGQLAKIFGKRNQYSEMYDEEIAKYTVEPPKSDSDEYDEEDDED
jgi:hypothetical protein